MRSATCAQTEKREEFGWLAGRNRGPSAIIEIRTARETPPLLALRGQKKARSMSGLWCSGGDEEDRTPDLRIANATLSQLSYVPTEWLSIAEPAWPTQDYPFDACSGNVLLRCQASQGL